MATPIRILLVDSDEAFLEPLQYVLNQAGYATFVARDGNAALAMVEQTSPDLLVIEAVLPRRSGFAVLENLGPRPFPVILTTNSLAQGQKQWAERLGTFDFLRKPFAMSALLESIERAVKGRVASKPLDPISKVIPGGGIGSVFLSKALLTQLSA
jgi:DNA-binding response OmpR family regulator